MPETITATPREAFFSFAPKHPPTKNVAVPGVGEVTVRGLTGAEWDRYESTCAGDGGKVKADRALLVRLSVIHGETGDHVFGDADLPRLAELPAQVLSPVAKAAVELSGASLGN